MKIEKQFLKTLRADIDAALKAVADKHGVKLHAGSCRFTDATATFKLEVATFGENGAVVDSAANDFNVYCSLFGMTAQHLGATFTSGGHTYKIVGLKPNSNRFPVIGEREDGKRFKFPWEGLAARTNVGDVKEVVA